MSFLNAINKLKKVIAFDRKAEIIKILNENKSALIELMQAQLSLGKDGNNEDVIFNRETGGTFYAPRTIKEKSFLTGLGAEIDHVTGFMIGEMYDSFDVEIGEDGSIRMNNLADHSQHFMFQTSDTIFVLNKITFQVFKEQILLPELKRIYEDFLHGL